MPIFVTPQNNQMFNELFGEDYGTGNQELQEGKDITTTILYMSRDEHKQFREIAKEGIKKMFGQDFQQKGNLTDFILTIIKMYNNDQFAGGEAYVKEALETQRGRSVKGQVS